jgi:rhodanese-related sulfurtransferase
MEQLIEFASNHWMLVSAFAGLLILLALDSSLKSGAKLTPTQLTQLINRESAVVLDIRDSAEFKKGHIVDAINIPHTQLEGRSDELKAFENRPIVLVCKDGQRAGMAGKTLLKQGFKVSRLGGGILDWTNQNLPLVTK